jgi:hypothetical protein
MKTIGMIIYYEIPYSMKQTFFIYCEQTQKRQMYIFLTLYLRTYLQHCFYNFSLAF